MYTRRNPELGSNMMQDYLERRMMMLHASSSQSVANYKEKVLAFFIGALTIITLPYLHIGIYHLKIWVPDKPRIQKNNCTCSCFDTVFRGAYENPGMTRYKHVYFNATWQTFRIWIFTVIFVLMAYESIKYLMSLIRKRSVRKSMLLLYILNIYPHYYSWWSYFSYYNEDFYYYFKHHMWFTVTEVISTCIVLNLCDKHNEIVSWKMLSVISINIMHIVVGAMDQFISDVVYGKGASFHKARNIALMLPDCLHVIIPLWELYILAKKREVKIYQICYREELITCFFVISFGILLGELL